MDRADNVDLAELHARARQPTASPDDVDGFAERALEEISQLRRRMNFLESLLERQERSSADAAELLGRQTSILLGQAERLAAFERRLERLAGVCDLAEWSEQTSGTGRRASVLVEDLRPILSR